MAPITMEATTQNQRAEDHSGFSGQSEIPHPPLHYPHGNPLEGKGGTASL